SWPARSTSQVWRRLPHIYCAAQLQDPSRGSAPPRRWRPSGHWRESESYFCVRRFPEKVAVLGADHSYGQQVPWLCRPRKAGEFSGPQSLKEREDSRIRNYIGREGVLKNLSCRLVLDNQRLSLWKKGAPIECF